MVSRALLPIAAALAVAAALPAAASAAPCSGDFKHDSEGYEWDFAATTAAFPALGTFEDGGAKSPPAPRSDTDSYDWWGALFVGGDAAANAYVSSSPGADVCFEEEQGRELVFPTTTIDGLQVHRRVYVSADGLPGARILNVVRNPGGAPRTTSVQVGDETDGGIFVGDLGSDDDTTVRSSSSGDDALTSADRWAVTSDHDAGGTNTDLALAHVFDGRGGADPVDRASKSNEDDLAYRWENVTIPPGGTVAYLSYEIQQGVAGSDGAAEDEAARRAALAYDANPLGQVFAGMTDQEIAAVRNWPHPAPTLAFSASAGSDSGPVAFSAAGSTASSVPGSCSGISYAWDFGGGATATGVSARHRFTAGAHVVKLTATNSCGGQTTRAETVSIADATAPAATLDVRRSARLGRLAVRVLSSEAGTATVAAKSGKRAIAKARVVLQAGQVRTVRLKVKRRVAAAVAGRRRVKVALAVTVTDAAGNATRLNRRIAVRP